MATDKKVQVVGDKVIFSNHETLAKDGAKVPLTLTFDFTGVDRPQLLKWASANRLIAWRTTGVKDLTEKELTALNGLTIKCAEQMEHIESAETVKARGIVEKAKNAGVPLDVLEKMLEDYKARVAEELAQAELETGEEIK